MTLTLQQIADRLAAAGWTLWHDDIDPANDIWARDFALFDPRDDSARGRKVCVVSMQCHLSDGGNPMAHIDDGGDTPASFYADDVRSADIGTRLWRALLRRDRSLSRRTPRP